MLRDCTRDCKVHIQLEKKQNKKKTPQSNSVKPFISYRRINDKGTNIKVCKTYEHTLNPFKCKLKVLLIRHIISNFNQKIHTRYVCFGQ